MTLPPKSDLNVSGYDHQQPLNVGFRAATSYGANLNKKPSSIEVTRAIVLSSISKPFEYIPVL
ncbi:hypothetical protein CXF82_21475 [Shewanella sp. GutDb-MelDb]|jgi:hypothetical protein|nr:hypothetical protein CXF82_21475 [Shewanella sp. GutDb-MelDb]